MKLGRRAFLKVAGGAIAVPGSVRAASAQVQVALKLHHPLTPVSNLHRHLLMPWAKKLEADAAAASASTSSPRCNSAARRRSFTIDRREGAADIVWTTPHHFPGLEVFELPFVAGRRAMANAKAAQEFAETAAKDDFKDVHPLAVWAHDHALIHTSRPIKAMHDLKGLKLRPPTRLAGEALKALGAHVVTVPMGQLTDAFAQRAIDGCVLPWEMAAPAKVPELVKVHTEIPGTPTLAVSTFMLVMNKGKYAALPADLRTIMDANTGQSLAAMAGKLWDDQAVSVEEAARKRGNTIAAISEDEAARWRKATAPVIESWGKQVKDGARLIEAARALIAKYEKGLTARNARC